MRFKFGDNRTFLIDAAGILQVSMVKYSHNSNEVINMKNLLVVVDYQKDFVDGALGFPGAEALDQAIAARISQYRARGDEVVFTLDTHHGDYVITQEGKKLPVVHCIEGSEGHKLYGQTAEARLPGDKVFTKNTFGSSQLFEYLYRLPAFGKIELCGLVSSICVISNAVLAKTAQPEAEIIIDSVLTAGADKELHEAALQVMGGLQMTIL